jgi:hypothetical protein
VSLLLNYFWLFEATNRGHKTMNKLKISKLLAISFIVCWTGLANSTIISTSEGDYNVTTTTGMFSSLEPELIGQIWWGNRALAKEFAELTEDLLGLQDAFGRQDIGPLFAICSDCSGFDAFPIGGEVWTNDNNATALWGTDDRIHTYAVAEFVPRSVPVPATIALFSLGLVGLWCSRRKKA